MTAFAIEIVTKCLYFTCHQTSETTSICSTCGLCHQCASHEICETGVLPWRIRKPILDALFREMQHHCEYAACRLHLMTTNDPWPLMDTRAALAEDGCYAFAQQLLAAATNRRPVVYLSLPQLPRADGYYSLLALPADATRAVEIRLNPTERSAALQSIQHISSIILMDASIGDAVIRTLQSWRAPQDEDDHHYWDRLSQLGLDQDLVGVIARPGCEGAGYYEVMVRERPELSIHKTITCGRCHTHPALAWQFPLCSSCAISLQQGIHPAGSEVTLRTTFINAYLPVEIAKELPHGYVQLRCGCQKRTEYEENSRMLKLANVWLCCPHHGSQDIVWIND